jgi:hypothetical protein
VYKPTLDPHFASRPKAFKPGIHTRTVAIADLPMAPSAEKHGAERPSNRIEDLSRQMADGRSFFLSRLRYSMQSRASQPFSPKGFRTVSFASSSRCDRWVRMPEVLATVWVLTPVTFPRHQSTWKAGPERREPGATKQAARFLLRVLHGTARTLIPRAGFRRHTACPQDLDRMP